MIDAAESNDPSSTNEVFNKFDVNNSEESNSDDFISSFVVLHHPGAIARSCKVQKFREMIPQDIENSTTLLRHPNPIRTQSYAAPNCVTRQALTWNPQGQRKRGRRKNTLRREMEIDMRKNEQELDGTRKEGSGQSGLENVGRLADASLRVIGVSN
ncbi:unnamed protein product [Schistosoma mattheei]|uniref:Uncharacterized protein n=1 Tax=Schistosoma mattheei TaxID=31246 RepID=A0A183P4X0_9TREM|nr:unnamed protein product [Schistosoma mattheei]